MTESYPRQRESGPETKRAKGERRQRERNTRQELYNLKYHFRITFLQILKRPKYIYNNLNMLKNKCGNPSPYKFPFSPPIQDSIFKMKINWRASYVH